MVSPAAASKGLYSRPELSECSSPSAYVLYLLPTETFDKVVVHHAYRLQKGVADGRTDECEAALFQLLTQRIRYAGPGWNILERMPRILLGPAIGKSPEEGIEATDLRL